MHIYKFKIIVILCTIELFTPFLSPVVNGKDFTVVIDPGHGGNDPGAIGRLGKEKNINLKVALKLGNLINENSPSTKVIFTRRSDVFIPLDRRAEIANNAKADLFISIHTNAVAKGKSVKGAETYTLGLHRSEENLEVAKRENSVILVENDYKQRYAGFNPNSAESYIMFEFLQDKNMESSVKLAKYIQSSFRNNVGRIDKGVHQAGFLVLRATSMPSVLIELGYISNPDEESYLLTENGTSQLAEGIFKAFQNYKRAVNKTKGISNDEPVIETASDTVAVITEQSYPYPVSTRKTSNKTNSTTREEKREERKEVSNNTNRPIFKIQIATSDKLLKSGDKIFKGLSPIDYYKENGIYKYTYQSDVDYNNVLREKRNISSKFKDAFVIAFKNGKKMDINEAIREFKRKR